MRLFESKIKDKEIGKTSSGKPIYRQKPAEEYKDFTSQDHKDAADAHYLFSNKVGTYGKYHMKMVDGHVKQQNLKKRLTESGFKKTDIDTAIEVINSTTGGEYPALYFFPQRNGRDEFNGFWRNKEYQKALDYLSYNAGISNASELKRKLSSKLKKLS